MSLTMSGFPCLRVSTTRKAHLHKVAELSDSRLTVYHRSRRCFEDRIHKLIAKSLPDVRRCPKKTDRHALLENTRSARSYTTACCDEDNTAEQWRDSEHPVARDTTDPEFGRWGLNFVVGPVTGLRDDKREACLVRHRDARKTVPFEKRAVGNANEVTGLRCDCGRDMSCGHSME